MEARKPKKTVNYIDENLWEYLRAKLYVKGLRDNNFTARQIWDYVSKHFTPKEKSALVENDYKCPIALWKKFSCEAKQVYNDVMESTKRNQDNIAHPATAKLPKAQWDTICHNFACYAAWAADKKL